MSYCKKCGAYIPDGQEVCLACGFSEAAEKNKQKSGAASYAYAEQSEEERRAEENARARAEQRRREQQEMNRKWAESEMRRRQQAEDFRRSQEEAARRSAEWEQTRSVNEDGFYHLHRTSTGGSGAARSTGESRTFAYLSYISFLCFLPTLLGVEDPFTRFHAKQGRKLFFASLLLSWIPGLNAIAWLFQLALAVAGIRNVSNGVMAELPVVGRLGEK